MKIVYTDKHKLRDAKTEIYGGEMVAPFERPQRLQYILDECQKRDIGEICAPRELPPPQLIARLMQIHDAGYVEFLRTVWAQWRAAGYAGEAVATSWPARRMAQKVPDEIDGKIGYYALAAETTICEGTWEAAAASAEVALSAADMVARGDESVAFALCRPPGHHAARDLYGGYCFINNAALAARHFVGGGMTRVAVLDVDFHHGNGTQDIFYERDDVLFVSLHGEPQNAFPYFSGYADETGAGAGAGYTANYPMPPGADYGVWSRYLMRALGRISDYGAQALVVSLGVDIFEKDPISFFKLTSDDIGRAGDEVARLDLPTVIVMEGGYAIAEVGVNTANFIGNFS